MKKKTMDNGTKSEQNVSQPDIKPLNTVTGDESESFNRPLCEKKKREIIKFPNQARKKSMCYLLRLYGKW